MQRIGRIVLGGLLLVALAACGGDGNGDDDPGPDEGTTATDGEVTDGTDPTDVTDPPDVTEATEPETTDETDATDEPEVTDEIEVTDVTETTETTDVTDVTDSTEPEICEECEELSPPNCGFCPLYAAQCNAIDPLACHNAAKDLVASGDLEVAVSNGSPIYPDCIQPVCNDAGTCELGPISGCCKDNLDCGYLPAPGGCFIPSCSSPDPTPSEALVENPPSYCQLVTLASCCEETPNQILADESFSSFPSLPAGWIETDNVSDDPVAWRSLNDDPVRCHSGGHCAHIGREDGCFSYFPGTLDADCKEVNLIPASCIENADCAAGEVCKNVDGADLCTPGPVVLTLQTPDYVLPADVPSSLLFQLRMNTEPPSDFLSGDNLTVWALNEGVEVKVFDSVDINNTTKGLPGSYRLVAIDLSAWSGKTVSFDFRFDTKDEELNFGLPGNLFDGVFLDDLRVQTTCQNLQCDSADAPACESSNPCEEASCALFEPKTPLSDEEITGICVTTPIENCEPCVEAEECDSPPATGGPYINTCEGGQCVYKAINCTEEAISAIDFEAGLPETWTANDDKFCANTWAVTTNRAKDGLNALHFGKQEVPCGVDEDASCGALESGNCPSYECEGLGTIGSVETEVYSLPPLGTLLLTFDLFLSTEWQDINFDPFFCDLGFLCADRLTLFAVLDGAEEVVWDSYTIEGTSTCDWASISVNISSYAGKNVSFRFEFDTGAFGTDAGFNDYEGPYIDNFSLQTKCGDLPCTTATLEADCVPESDCYIPSCGLGVCQFELIEGCCAKNSDCDDGIACTDDICDLEEGCSHKVSEDPTCCDPLAAYWQETFDGDALPEGFEITVNEPDEVKWQWGAALGAAGTGGLYFGNIETTSYEAGVTSVSGSVTLPPLDLPFGGDPVLAFDLKLGTEFDDYSKEDFASYLEAIDIFAKDRLSAEISIDGGESFVMVWRSENQAPLKGSTLDLDGDTGVVWQGLSFSLKPYAGTKGAILRFTFDTFGGDFNAFEGARLDNLALRQVCATPENPDPCYSSPWCEDFDGCTIDTCESALCIQKNNTDKDGCCFADPITTYNFEGPDPGWTFDEAAAVGWHVSAMKAGNGSQSLRFGHVTESDYSTCTCASDEACNGVCLPDECGAAPEGIATSPEFEMDLNSDYEISFSLFADLDIDEGSVGFVEAFQIKLLWDSGPPYGVQEVATLVCHAGICDKVVDGSIDPCVSGKNFKYPGCADDPSGDYGKWVDYKFKLSDVLCTAAQSNGTAETFIATLATDGAASFHISAEFKSLDNTNNCNSGLYVDDVQFAELCDGWDAKCSE